MGERPSITPRAGFVSTDAKTMAVPRVFGRLLLLKLLARGGMGDVYLAATTGIEGAERACVVKTVRRDHIHDGSFLARFLDEARVQSQLNHPGVAQVLEAATDENGEPYTVVEYVEGRSLADVRQRAIQLGARIGWPEAVSLAIEMAQALAHVHDRAGADGTPLGIVHRDLSPQNVMVGYSGEVKLIDFGTARGHNRRCHTVAGVVFAKPGYVAPEVARQEVGDARIDLYALGIMLWELCAGRRFLTGDAQQHLEDAAAGKLVVPEIAKKVGAPALLDEAIARLTANDPDARYTGAALAATDLAKVLSEAAASKSGERGVRGRIQGLMKALWTQEPGRSRAEFAKLLKEARTLKTETVTPPAGQVADAALAHMNDDPSMLSGTPYRLIRKIGEGASGAVYEAEHVELCRLLALKVLAPEHGSASDAVERFRREARSIAALSHPNLCLLYDFGRALDGRIFLAMELLTGETLDKRVRATGGMDFREAVSLAIEVTHALEAAHGAGLVHRDLKPANLFLTKGGGLKLLDFGVAMALSDGARDEQRQKGFAIFGTPEYMAPEQVAGEVVDGRCDIYALGCVLYELITGHRPFEGDSSVVVMGKQLRETPEGPRSRAPERAIPKALEAVVMTALAKKPENRFANAAAMRSALERVLRAPTPRQKRARGIAALVLGAAGALAVGALTRLPELREIELDTTALHRVLAVPPSAQVELASAAPSSVSLEQPATSLPAPDATVAAAVVAKTAPAEALPMADAIPASAFVADAPAPREARDGDDAPPAREHTARVADARRETSSDVRSETKSDARSETKSDARGDAKGADPRAERHLAVARSYAKAHPGEVAGIRAWATAAVRAGDLRDARRAADIWALHDGSAEPRLFLASVLEQLGHRTDARAVIDEVLEIHPDSAEARRLRARMAGETPRRVANR